jgi:hypothetical protein
LDVLGYQTGDLGCWVPDDVQKRNDIWSSCEVLEDLNLSLDFLLFDRLEDLDDTFLLANNVYALKDLKNANELHNDQWME